MGTSIECRAEVVDPRVDLSCHQARSSCDGERWGLCVDAYSHFCTEINFGPEHIDPDEENSNNVGRGVDGELILVPDEKTMDFGYVWIANTGENTVSKFDAATGREVGRYPCVMDGIPGLPIITVPHDGGGEPWSTGCANCPSRTAIDFNGDAYVANRAFSDQGSVTKFANAVEDCIDYNNNGVIDTSWDANDDGHIDVTDSDEFKGFADECVLWTVPVGNDDGIPRALAIDAGAAPDLAPEGNVWVGLYNEERACQLDGRDGSLNTCVDFPGVHPYGAAIDGAGRAWFVSINDGAMAQVETFTGTLVDIKDINANTGCSRGYGIAIDVRGRIWIAGFQCNSAIRYDPIADDWATIDIDPARGPTRGIAPDLEDTVWVAHTDGWVTRFDANALTELNSWAIDHHLSNQTVDNTIGVGIDRYGACWVVSMNRYQPEGTATRILPGGQQDSWSVGQMPYTYSDFTGFGLFTVTRPSGWYNMIVSACEDPDPNPPDTTTDWHSLDWQESEPPGTDVWMRFKVGDDLDTLADQAWWGPYDDPPVDLDAEGVPNTQYMLLQVLLSSTDINTTPSFMGFQLDFDCGDATPTG
jgi:hypothetical protein